MPARPVGPPVDQMPRRAEVLLAAVAVGAVLMGAATIVVALNAQTLRRLDLRPRN
jgi:hypothetical protein